MKALLAIFFAALITLVGCTDPAEESKEEIGQIMAGWEITTHPHGLDINTRDLLFLDEQAGFVVGFNGKIFKTTDGGETWQQKNSGTNLGLVTVSFIDMENGFIAGPAMNCIDGDCGRGAIFLTTKNGGETWTKDFFPEYDGFDDIHFFDEMHGIAMISVPNQLEGTDYVLGRTADGGTSWTITELPVQMYSKFHVVDGIAFAQGRQHQILKTTDAGETWSSIAIPMEAWHEIRRIYFYNESIGFVDGVKGLFRTTDGGLNWEIADLPFNSMYVFHSYDEHEAFNIEGVYRYEGGEFPQFKGTISQRTTDGGENWQVSEASETLMLGLTVFPSRSLGYSIYGRDFYTLKRK